MTGQQRKCANCRFYDDAGMPGNGWCTHPKRQLNSGVKLLVRAGELACRNTWGGDLFQGRLDDTDAPPAADLPASERDDEVTSVTIPTNKPAPAEDRVVHDRPAARQSQPLDSNEAAHRDQEERARAMARGSRDALAHARQRYSSRRQAPRQVDVVADDDVIESGDSRVVTRQQRFSDRAFASGMPPLPTAPVPSDEVRARGVASEDRFDTVPEIDPDFDMPGQRRRLEPEPVAPTPARAPEQEPLDELDLDQITAYEHVLQRARRIRESKQDRAKPVRRPHAFLEAESLALESAEPWPDHHHDDQASGWHEDDDAPGQPDPEPIRVEPEWVDSATIREAWPGTYEDQGAEYDAERDDIGTTGASDVDAEGSFVEEDASWEDASWDDDGYVDEPTTQRTGWLNRLRLGLRRSESLHDDATITRHASTDDEWVDDATDAWLNDAPLEPDDEPYDDRMYADHGHAEHDHIERNPWERTDHGEPEVLHRDPAPAWPDDYDDLPPWRGGSAAHHIEELPAPAPVPPPVPAIERASGAWDVSGMPVRTAHRSRQRTSAELPDLDDALFDDERAVHFEHRSDVTTDAGTEHHQIQASARDSFFRSSRYPRLESPPAHAEGVIPEALDPESLLPDLEEGRLDLRDVVARGAEPIDRRIDVAPDIPRECRTCRSFRSADGGTRGWCTNEWAFTHRRMVNEDDLACVSAIGCWWMPADHLRLELDEDLGDVRTPRMDELIARNRPAARKVAGE